MFSRRRLPEEESGPLEDGRTRSVASALGADADEVRVHTGAESARSAEARGLEAYTVGQDVVLGQRAARPGPYRDAVLAHELVHVAQQAGAPSLADGSLEGVPRGSATAEHDADRATPAAVGALVGARPGPARRPGRIRALALQGCPTPAADEARAKIKALQQERDALSAVTASNSGRSFGEVAAAFGRLKDVEHDLGVAETGRGTYAGSKANDTSGAKISDCTQIVMEVLGATFAQQGRSADWAKVRKALKAHTKARGGGGMSGLDLQAALQSELGWKGVYWAPDPTFAYKDEDVSRVKGTESSYTYGKAKKGTYYQGFGKAAYPGVSVDHTVVDYGPEPGSTTKADTSSLQKLSRLPFGVLTANGANHMTILASGNVIEVHWKEPSTSPDVLTQTPLEKWAIGARSGVRYFTSGVVVAPAADIDAAFR